MGLSHICTRCGVDLTRAGPAAILKSGAAVGRCGGCREPWVRMSRMTITRPVRRWRAMIARLVILGVVLSAVFLAALWGPFVTEGIVAQPDDMQPDASAVSVLLHGLLGSTREVIVTTLASGTVLMLAAIGLSLILGILVSHLSRRSLLLLAIAGPLIIAIAPWAIEVIDQLHTTGSVLPAATHASELWNLRARAETGVPVAGAIWLGLCLGRSHAPIGASARWRRRYRKRRNQRTQSR